LSRFESRVALITGASKGIGKAIALKLAANGASIIAIARSKDLLDNLVDQVSQAGSKASAYSIDLKDLKQLDKLFEELRAKHPRVDFVVNDAGMFESASLAEHSNRIWLDTMQVNLTAPFLFARELLAQLKSSSSGRIINIASMSGHKPELYASAYCASKAGLIGLTKALALELAKDNINVNAIAPGWVNTDLAMHQLSDMEWLKANNISLNEAIDTARQSIPLQRIIEPDEIAELVSYLCSDHARNITGQCLTVCGGLSL
jgi:ketoreductase